MNDSASRRDQLGQLPAVLTPVAERWLERFDERHGADALDDALLPLVLKTVACSEFAGNVMLNQWPDVADSITANDPAGLMAALESFAADFDARELDDAAAKRELRVYRDRHMLALLVREVAGTATLAETLDGLSALADVLLAIAVGTAERRLNDRFGTLRDADGARIPLVVLGMGKLGGYELNFSSDIDIIFLYPREGTTDGRRSLGAQEYCTRLTRNVIALLDEKTVDGFAFRIDTRLRPFGDSGPPVVGFAALEDYLSKHGRDWERYAYVKARIVGPDPGSDVRAELFDELVDPFVYRRYLDFGVFESLRDMHAMITAEVKRRELKDNVKLGPGGIREIEFIVQSIQIVRGGSVPALKGPSLMSVLPRLVSNRGIRQQDADELEAAYRFLRRVENFIQAINDRQTHDLPADEVDQARLCLAMGFADWPSLIADLDQHRRNVSRHFAEVAIRDVGGDDDARVAAYRELWSERANSAAWRDRLAADGVTDAEALADVISRFQSTPQTARVDADTRRRLKRFVPRLLDEVVTAEHPVHAFERALTVVDSVLRRSAYIALLNENRLATERLVSLCSTSNFVAEQIKRTPVLLDELLEPGIGSEPIAKAELREELDARLASHRDGDAEVLMNEIAQFQRAVQFRVAVADAAGHLPIMKVSDSLTWLAETVVERALDVAMNELVARHGVPQYDVDGVRRDAGFLVVAYGKLGGLELSYGSDLDLVFLHDSRGSRQQTSGDKSLDNSMFFGRLVRKLVHYLTVTTSSGGLYEVDTRLRPSGRSGLLVSSVDAFSRYQEENAWTWEHQALLRARPIAGSESLAKAFEQVRAETLTGRVRTDALKDDVLSMRGRMMKELDESSSERFHLKQGRGGLTDIEFLVQYLVLANAARSPQLFHFSDNIRQLDALAASGCLPEADAARLQDIYRAYRLRLHRLALDEEPPMIPVGDFEAERGFVRELWQRVFDGG